MEILKNKPVFKFKYNFSGEVIITANNFEDALRQFRNDFKEEDFRIKEIEGIGYSNIIMEVNP